VLDGLIGVTMGLLALVVVRLAMLRVFPEWIPQVSIA
jgi:hypothetical protein